MQVDAPSAYRVLQSSHPTLVPLSVTVETALRRAHLPRLRTAGPLARLIAHQAEAWAKDERFEERFEGVYLGLPEDIHNFQHDPLTCAVALGWHDGVQIRQMGMEVTLEDGWICQREVAQGLTAQIVTAIEASKFNRLWLDTVTGV